VQEKREKKKKQGEKFFQLPFPFATNLIPQDQLTPD